MTDFVTNPFIGKGLPTASASNSQQQNYIASTNYQAVQKLLDLCPIAKTTPLHHASNLAETLGVGNLYLKDERVRMGLGSFKALGASYVIASMAAKKLTDGVLSSENLQAISAEQWQTALNDMTFITASAGNHGLSLAAGARIFGAKAVIYLAKTVPTDFATRLRDFGAEVVIEGDDYDASLAAAMTASQENGWFLLADGTWEGYNIGRDVMEGYLIMADEAFKQMQQMDRAPTHIFLQAGVGGLAAAAAIMAREFFAGDNAPQIIIVEPDQAPCLQQSIVAGELIEVSGGVSNMGRLDCKVPSLVALHTLALTANEFMLVSDDEAQQAIDQLAQYDFATTPSGGAGFAGLTKALACQKYGIDANSHVLIFLSEQAL